MLHIGMRSKNEVMILDLTGKLYAGGAGDQKWGYPSERPASWR